MVKFVILIFALAVEILLLTIILALFILGILGFFLPVMPGIVLVGAGAAIYSLMIKSNFGAITPRLNNKLINNKDKILSLPIIKQSMWMFNYFKSKPVVRDNTEVVKNGVILFGFNILLVLFFVFANLGISFLVGLTNSSGVVAAFVPLLTIFVFSALSAIIWYRFGQILGSKFKQRRVLNSTLVVLISILPLLTLLFLLSSIVDLVGGFKQEVLVLTFLSILLISILASVFELVIVALGVATAKK